MFSEKFIFWSIIVAALGCFFYSIHAILLPFILAFIISYFLNPSVDWIEKQKIHRTAATAIVLLCFLTLIFLIIATIAPLVRDQVSAFITRIPKYSNFIVNSAIPSLHDKINTLNPYIAEKVKTSLEDSASSFLSYLGYMITSIFKSGFALVNILSFIFISPIIAFYALRDWNKTIDKFYELFPSKNQKMIREQFEKIDQVLSNFIRGQTTVCLFLAIFYSLGLTLTGLDFGLFVGLLTGILSFIPYVGAVTGFVISITLAFIQFTSINSVLPVVLVFALGQFIEGNFITPKIVGEKVGLHPVMIFLALFAGGSLFGFIGVLFAIPVAAILGVIIQFLTTIYKTSSYYKG